MTLALAVRLPLHYLRSRWRALDLFGTESWRLAARAVAWAREAVKTLPARLVG